MKRVLLFIICICMILITFVSCGKENSQVPDEQVKYDIISAVDSIANIEDSITEWSISHETNSDTHTDSLKIYIIDENNIIYENDSYRYTYNSQTDLWSLNEDRVKPWSITRVYNKDVILSKWLGAHQKVYKSTELSPNYYMNLNVFDFDFNEGTVELQCVVSIKKDVVVCLNENSDNYSKAIRSYDEAIDFGRKKYKVSNIAIDLGIYKIKDNEIKIDATNTEISEGIGDSLFVDIYESTEMYDSSSYLHYSQIKGSYNEETQKFDTTNVWGPISGRDGFIYPKSLKFNTNGEIELIEKIRLSGNAGNSWTTRAQLESEQDS